MLVQHNQEFSIVDLKNEPTTVSPLPFVRPARRRSLPFHTIWSWEINSIDQLDILKYKLISLQNYHGFMQPKNRKYDEW